MEVFICRWKRQKRTTKKKEYKLIEYCLQHKGKFCNFLGRNEKRFCFCRFFQLEHFTMFIFEFLFCAKRGKLSRNGFSLLSLISFLLFLSSFCQQQNDHRFFLFAKEKRISIQLQLSFTNKWRVSFHEIGTVKYTCFHLFSGGSIKISIFQFHWKISR